MVEGSCDATTKQYSFLIDKQPIVCADGLMMKCCIIDNSYVPQEMIGYDDFIGSVKRAIDIAKTPDCSPKISRRVLEDEHNRPRANSSGSQSSVSSPPQHRRTNSSGRSRAGSLKSPHSVLLKAATKPKDLDRNSTESISSLTEEERCLKEKYTAQIKEINNSDDDYVYMETLQSISQASAIIEAIIENKVPTVIDIELNNDCSMTFCYQAINNFKQEFMMLKLKSDYCLFLAPF